MGIRVSSWPAGLAVLTILLVLSPAQASTDGLGPFPVRNFQPHSHVRLPTPKDLT